MQGSGVGSGNRGKFGDIPNAFTGQENSGCLTSERGSGIFRTNSEQTREIPMGTAAPQPTLSRLRQTLADIDPSNAPRLAGEERLVGLADPIDRALGGGLACGAL